MPFTTAGSDLSLTNQEPQTSLYNFNWVAGDPQFDDTQQHRVASLLVEHKPSPKMPGYWADPTGLRGSLLYTLQNVVNSTPSQAEAYASDALQKAVDDGAIVFERSGIQARRVKSGITLQVQYTANNTGQAVVTTIGK